ncbi:hypothetical protein [Streptomyces paromomycinus]|uniref:Uncharacterized protein n=1 Tax=Streptomyces paromomycinus TaxID=92743 RepID=A0A401WGI6_STREY|nr:hypothetical protein [Streptomyces paromomycinus]GCD48421.1 hypothetical protein GKJPGBOP_08219 [Streptomyces paromomycinus]
MARKEEQIADPRVVDFYLVLGQALDHTGDDPRLVELADELAAYLMQAAGEQGEDYVDDADIEPSFVKLMDTLAFDTAPPARRLIGLLKQRGWTGWTKLERVEPARGAAGSRQNDAAGRGHVQCGSRGRWQPPGQWADHLAVVRTFLVCVLHGRCCFWRCRSPIGSPAP